MLFRNFLLILGGLFVIAGLALAVIWLRQIGASPQTASEQGAPNVPGAAPTPIPGKLSVLTATAALPSGTLLRASDIGWREIEQGAFRPGSLLQGQISETDLLGSVTRRDFAEGEALIASELVMPGDRQFLAAVLKPGSRAATISVEAQQSASGLVLPGDFVDVILTQNLSTEEDPKRKTVGETVLQNLRVVAVGHSLGGQIKTPVVEGAAAAAVEALVPKTVTLELTQRQAETLFVAAQLGALQLSVRPLEATAAASAEDAQDGPTWASDVSPALKEIKIKPPPDPSASTIENSIRRPPARLF